MSAVPSADERYSFEPEGFLVVESILDRDHVARLRAALQRAIARRRELEQRGTPQFARPGVTMQALSAFDTFPGATQVCCPAGSCVNGATGSMSYASTTDARAAPPTANSRTAVLSARVG